MGGPTVFASACCLNQNRQGGVDLYLVATRRKTDDEYALLIERPFRGVGDGLRNRTVRVVNRDRCRHSLLLFTGDCEGDDTPGGGCQAGRCEAPS